MRCVVHPGGIEVSLRELHEGEEFRQCLESESVRRGAGRNERQADLPRRIAARASPEGGGFHGVWLWDTPLVLKEMSGGGGWKIVKRCLESDDPCWRSACSRGKAGPVNGVCWAVEAALPLSLIRVPPQIVNLKSWFTAAFARVLFAFQTGSVRDTGELCINCKLRAACWPQWVPDLYHAEAERRAKFCLLSAKE